MGLIGSPVEQSGVHVCVHRGTCDGGRAAVLPGSEDRRRARGMGARQRGHQAWAIVRLSSLHGAREMPSQFLPSRATLLAASPCGVSPPPSLCQWAEPPCLPSHTPGCHSPCLLPLLLLPLPTPCPFPVYARGGLSFPLPGHWQLITLSPGRHWPEILSLRACFSGNTL